MTDSKGKGKEVVRAASLQSKFFGGAKAVENQVEVLELDDTDDEDEDEEGEIEILEVKGEVEEEEEDEFPDDEDVPTEYYQSEWDEDALAVLEEIEFEFGQIPSPQAHIDSDSEELQRAPLSTSPVNRKEISSSVGISSPDVTPKKRRKLSSQAAVTEEEADHDANMQENVEIDGGVSQSAGAITSPYNSDMDDQDEEELMSSPSGSPTLSRTAHTSLVQPLPDIKIEKVKLEKIKIEKENVVKQEKGLVVDQEHSKTLWLSSDPIDVFSEPTEVEDDDISEASTTAELKRRKKIAEGKKKKLEEVDVKPLRIKVEKKLVMVSKETVSDLIEGDENLPSVASVWRERFMNTSSSGGGASRVRF